MPDVGTRPPHPVSHTSTQQWQSFEGRMRYRRAERCVLRAEAALDAGMEEDARAALAEARALNGDTPDFDSLRATVLQRRALAHAAARRTRARRALAVGFGTIAVLAGAVTMWPTSERGTPRPSIPAAAAAAVPSPSGAQPVSLSPNPAPSASTTPSTAFVAPKTEAVVPTSGETPKPADPLPLVQLSPKPGASESALPEIEKIEPQLHLASSTTGTASAAATPPSTSGADRLVTELPTATIPIPKTPPAPPPPAPAPDPRTIEEPQVRAVLAQFEAAYTNLSAQAARAVWPGVDERALARAFDNLESQQVALGQCSVDISGTSATAACAGTASWTPKVGGGRRTEARQWRFDLAKANGVWRIERAVAR
jgi:hypothetical protein